MSLVEYHTILKYYFMISLFPNDDVCLICRKVCLDTFEGHTVNPRELPSFKYWHNFVRNVLFDMFQQAGVSAKNDVPMNFMMTPKRGSMTLMPTNIFVNGCVWEKYTCVDLTEVSPFVGLGTRGFTVGQTILKEVSSKVAKHEKWCFDHQHTFLPFVVDTYVLRCFVLWNNEYSFKKELFNLSLFVFYLFFYWYCFFILFKYEPNYLF